MNELVQFNPELLGKERIISISKADMLDEELKAAIAKEFPIPVLFFSSVAQQGLQELKDSLWRMLQD